LRALRQRKSTFLVGLSPAARAALVEQPGAAARRRVSGEATTPSEQLLALRAAAVVAAEGGEQEGEGGGGMVLELVDVGANLQERCSRVQMERQLLRAGAAGVGAVVLTGCSMGGSREGARACEWWASVGSSSGGGGGGGHGAPALYCTAGVHPHDAKSIAHRSSPEIDYHHGAGGSPPSVTVDPEALAGLRSLAATSHCVALGECGLDYDRMFSAREVQLAVFEAQVSLAVELGCPLFVHVRDVDIGKGEPLGAYGDLARILTRSGLDPERVCVHCFTGGADELAELVEAGYYIGFTGFVGMAKRAAANGTLAALASGNASRRPPLSRILLETDAPFMQPDQEWLPQACGFSKRKNEPAALAGVCRAVAAALQDVTPQQLAAASTANACRFFRIPHPGLQG
jgi:TatD DNase family protein